MHVCLHLSEVYTYLPLSTHWVVVHVGINATHCVLPIPASHQTTQHSGVCGIVVTQTINSMLH